jgi:hypothetical protein
LNTGQGQMLRRFGSLYKVRDITGMQQTNGRFLFKKRKLLRKQGDDAQWAATSTCDFHREGDEVGAGGRELIEVGDVFEDGDVFFAERDVRFEMR